MGSGRVRPRRRWRDKDQGQPIDASGEWWTAEVQGIEDLKAVLISRKEEFTRAFVQHMLAYALGRKLDYYDAKSVARNHRPRSLGMITDSCAL